MTSNLAPFPPVARKSGALVGGQQRGVTGVHACALSVLLWALVSTLLGGCGTADECTRFGEFKCENNSAMFCASIEDGNGGHNIWQTTSCGAGACELDVSNAFCALSSTPDPHCGDQEYSCDGSNLVQCKAGYAVATHDCKAEVNAPTSDSPGVSSGSPYCVAPYDTAVGGTAGEGGATSASGPLPGVPSAFCANEPTPNPACTFSFSGQTIFCSGNDLLYCSSGYLQSKTSCDVPCCGQAP